MSRLLVFDLPVHVGFGDLSSGLVDEPDLVVLSPIPNVSGNVCISASLPVLFDHHEGDVVRGLRNKFLGGHVFSCYGVIIAHVNYAKRKPLAPDFGAVRLWMQFFVVLGAEELDGVDALLLQELLHSLQVPCVQDERRCCDTRHDVSNLVASDVVLELDGILLHVVHWSSFLVELVYYSPCYFYEEKNP